MQSGWVIPVRRTLKKYFSVPPSGVKITASLGICQIIVLLKFQLPTAVISVSLTANMTHCREQKKYFFYFQNKLSAEGTEFVALKIIEFFSEIRPTVPLHEDRQCTLNSDTIQNGRRTKEERQSAKIKMCKFDGNPIWRMHGWLRFREWKVERICLFSCG